jgi:hypothetical protein
MRKIQSEYNTRTYKYNLQSYPYATEYEYCKICKYEYGVKVGR